MKNKYILATAALLSAVSFTACDDMLDTDPRATELNKATFPGTINDVKSENAATYSIMNVLSAEPLQFPQFIWEIMSDNCYGSGGLQDNEVKSFHYLVEMNPNQVEPAFIALYGGISRANGQIETIDNVPWTEATKATRNQLLGEGYFMRGLYNLWLTQMFGDVPLITSANITEEMRKEVSAEDKIYPQILSDFVSAMNLMGTEKSSGHANKFVAEGFLARAYMFYQGFYKNKLEMATATCDDVALVSQEGCDAATLSKQDVIDALEDVIEKGGYTLCEDYRSLWQYSNSYVWDECFDGEGHSYDFIKDMKPENCYDMPGMGNGNTEEMFQIQYMNASNWAIGDGYYNHNRQYSCYLSCFWGLRNTSGANGKRENTYPFNQGWGQGTPSLNIWEDWEEYEAANAVATVAWTGEKGDIRKLGSLIDLKNELDNYAFEADDCEESGYSVKKFNAVSVDKCEKDLETWWSVAIEGFKSSLENGMQGDLFSDYYLMRYPDVLLMHSEMTGTADGMNQVQDRAGVKQTPYSLEAIQNERRWEFAFEGIRFNDMRRWTGNKPTAESYAPKMLQAQEGKITTCYGKEKKAMKHMTCSWTKRYIDTNGFLAKPQSQITLMNGKMTQNPGWDASDEETQYVPLY